MYIREKISQVILAVIIMLIYDFFVHFHPPLIDVNDVDFCETY